MPVLINPVINLPCLISRSGTCLTHYHGQEPVLLIITVRTLSYSLSRSGTCLTHYHGQEPAQYLLAKSVMYPTQKHNLLIIVLRSALLNIKDSHHHGQEPLYPTHDKRIGNCPTYYDIPGIKIKLLIINK